MLKLMVHGEENVENGINNFKLVEGMGWSLVISHNSQKCRVYDLKIVFVLANRAVLDETPWPSV